MGPRGGTASPCFLPGVLREPPGQDRRRKPGSWTLLRGSPSLHPLPAAMTLGMGAAVTPPPGEGPWLSQALGACVPGRARDLAGRAARSPGRCGRHCSRWSLRGKAGTGGSVEGGRVRICGAVGCSRTRIIASETQRHLITRTHRLLVTDGPLFKQGPKAFVLGTPDLQLARFLCVLVTGLVYLCSLWLSLLMNASGFRDLAQPCAPVGPGRPTWGSPHPPPPSGQECPRQGVAGRLSAGRVE